MDVSSCSAHMLTCARAHTSVYSRVHVRCQCACTLTCERWWGFTSHVHALARVCVHSRVRCCTHVACTCVCLHLPTCSPMCPFAHTCAWQRRCLPWHSGAGGARGPRVHEGCPRDPTCAWRPCTRAVYTQGPRRPRQHKGCACTRPMCAQSHIHTQEHT